MIEAALGLRVVRGPDWEEDDQDGGEGFVGTVVGLEGDGGRVTVQWDMGQRNIYRCGHENKFDLRLLGSGPSGYTFSTIPCHVCRKKRVYGVIWRCLHCSQYYLCSVCYHAEYHCLLHRFACLMTKDGKQFRVSSRSEARRIPAKGLYPGAVVMRGCDWRWRDQDGGEGNTGKVVELTGWSSNQDSTRSEHSVVVVVWENGTKKKYRAGHKGKVDVRCITPGSEMSYYPEHLPILGREYGSLDVSSSASDGGFVTGDRVKCDVDIELLTSLQDNPIMAEKIGLMLDHVGTVNSLLENGDLLVRYPSNTLLPVNPQAAKKVDIPVFECGDVVRMISDMAEAYRLQQGHGEWNDDMALCLDQVGTVVKTVGDVNVLVHIAGYRWVLNPCCLLPAPGETLSPNSNFFSAHHNLLPDRGLSLLLDTLGPSILVHATSNGDIHTVKRFLEKNPHQVNTMEQGKTVLHVAIETSRLEILKVILRYNPDMSMKDSDGNFSLHTCAYQNAIQASTLLLEAGADVNSINTTKQSITPIMIAGAVGHFDLLELMTSHHTADVNVQDMQGQTALHHVISSQRTRAVPILLTAGADLTLLNSNLLTPLLEATGYGFLPGVEDIVRWRPDLKDNGRPTDNVTPLQLACVRNSYYIARYLALSGCSMNTMTDKERTALHITSIEGHCAIMDCLVGYGVDINARDSDGNTVLHILFVNKNARSLSNHTPQINKVHDELSRLPLDTPPVYLTVACFMVQEGGDLSIRNNRGQTAVDICSPEKRDVLLNFVNKSNRGEFHGSLKSSKTSVTAESASNCTETKPNIPVASTSATHKQDTVPDSVQQFRDQLHRTREELVKHKGGPDVHGSLQERDRGLKGSIMEARLNVVTGAGGHRERDRLKLLEERKKESVSDESLTAEERRKQVRKQRETYFRLSDQKHSKTSGSLVKEVVDTRKKTAEDQLQTECDVKQQPRKKIVLEERRRETLASVVEHSAATHTQKNEGTTSKNGEQMVEKNNETTTLKDRKQSSALLSRHQTLKQSSLVSKKTQTTSPPHENSSLQDNFNIKDGANAAEPCFLCERPADARFIPCGHMVACRTCGSRPKRCSICKVMITGVS